MSTSKFRSILLPAVLALAPAGGLEGHAKKQTNSPAGKEPRVTEEHAAPANEPEPPNVELEALIKAAGYTYSRRPSGVLEIVADRGAEPFLVWSLERPAFTRKKKNNEEVKVAVFFYVLASLHPEQAANPPFDLLRKIDRLNDQLAASSRPCAMAR